MDELSLIETEDRILLNFPNFKALYQFMKHLYYRALSILKRIKSKIAFYPTVFAISGIFLAFFMSYMENRGISQYLHETLPGLTVDDGDTALAILGALVTGLISMMVFSFSMVMLLLSQASNNYSPRLLPGLISDKVHQVILGIFLATILYLIFVLFSISPAQDKYELPGFSILIGIVFMVICIYAFIYFIHNISQTIQISKILDRIYMVAKFELKTAIENEQEIIPTFPNTDSWFEYYINNSGYLQGVGFTNLAAICKKENTQLHILPIRGMFVLKGLPLFRSRKELKPEEVDRILSNFSFDGGELVSDNYVFAFKQITEIIVKAMSPGINDPGTALNGIDYLTELLSLRMSKRNSHVIVEENNALIKINTAQFNDLLYNIMASIRAYGKHDILIIQKLLIMLNYLKSQPARDLSYLESVNREIEILLADAKESLPNPVDYKKALEIAEGFELQK